MSRAVLATAGVLAALALAAGAGPAHARTLRGVVYADANGDGKRQRTEPGVRAIVAYEQHLFVETDAEGRFTLEVSEVAAGIIWVRVPDGYAPGPVWGRPSDRELALGVRPLARSHRGPLTFVVASDTHLAPEQPFHSDLAGVVAAATALEPAPAFFTILGDITQGNEDSHFELVDAGLAQLRVPYVPVPGNHDWYDGGANWFRRYGPDNYSFDIADTHFVVWNMSMPQQDIEAYLGAELARVDPAMTIVALTHAPPIPPILAALRKLGVDYVLSGHTHTNRVVDHGGLIELTTEPLLMGGLDFMPAGYRVVTLDRGALAAYHRTVVPAPQLVVVAPAADACVPASGAEVLVASELDAGAARVTATVDCGEPAPLTARGGWAWHARLPPLAPGAHMLAVEAAWPSGRRATQQASFTVCDEPAPAAPADAAWPQLGGTAQHAGVAPGAIRPPLAQRWAAAVGGHVLQASPVIGHGAVFVTATDLGRGDTGGVVALELATGAVRWRHHSTTPIRSGAAIVGSVVVAGELDGTVLGLDARTGRVRWRYELGAGLPPEAGAVLAPPTVDGPDVVYGNQRHLAVLDGETGAARWTVEPVPGGQYSQSLAAVAVGEGAIVGTFHRELGGLVAWDRATGRERWRLQSLQTTAINASPVIAGGMVFVVNGLTEVLAIDLATGTVRGLVKLEPQGFDWGHATIGTPALARGTLVVPTLYGALVALDAGTGAERWRFAGRAGPLRAAHYRGAALPGFEASPVIAGDLVWAVDVAGQLTALELATGRPVWERGLGVPVLAGLAAAGDGLVIASYDGIVRALGPVAQPRSAPPLVPCARSRGLERLAGWPFAAIPLGAGAIAIGAWRVRRRRSSRRAAQGSDRASGA